MKSRVATQAQNLDWSKPEEEIEGAVETWVKDDSEIMLIVSEYLPNGEYGVYLYLEDGREIELARDISKHAAIDFAQDFMDRSPLSRPTSTVERKLDSKGRASLQEFAEPGDTVEIAFLGVKDD